MRRSDSRMRHDQGAVTGKAIAVVALAAAAAGGGWYTYLRIREAGEQGQRRRPPAIVAVETTPVRKASLRDVGVFTGTLQPRSQFLVSPKIAGRLVRLLVNVGDSVKRGQLIAELDDEEFAQQAEQARAELKVAQANVENCTSDLEVAQREYERVKTLRQKKIASESELDAAEAQYKACQARHKVAIAQVAQKDAALKAADIRLSYTKLQAWWEAGDDAERVVGERFVDEGAQLKANEAVVSILEDRRLTAVVHVIERDYPKVKIGQQATIDTDAYPNQTFAGRIVRIAPLLRESSRQARVELDVPNPQRQLRTGMFVRARIEFDRHDDVTAVPVPAVIKRSGQQGVFLADEQTRTARFVPLTLGISNGGMVEVLAPALTGQVITLGQHMLEDGSPIVLGGFAAGGGPATSRASATAPSSATGPAGRSAGATSGSPRHDRGGAGGRP